MKQRDRIAKAARPEHVERLAHTIASLSQATGINRSGIYRAIASGQLRSFKFGRRRMFSDQAAREFIADLERGDDEQ